MSDLKAETVIRYCAGRSYPAPVPEYRFLPGRKFRADLGWPAERVLMEFEGAIYGTGRPCPACRQRTRGGHSSVGGLVRDILKYNLAAIAGYRVVRISPLDLKTGAVFGWLDRLFATGAVR